MNRIQRSLRIAMTVAMVIGLVAMTTGVVSAGGSKHKTTAYNDVPKHLPGNVVSLGYEATSTSEFGDAVTLAGHARRADSVEVVLSSWGCGTRNVSGDCVTARGAKFTHPITLRLYAVGVGGEPGALILTKTQTFAIPFRPSSDLVRCTGDHWWSQADQTCYSGLATKITFKLNGTVLPTNLIWTIGYNTTHHGYAPIGEATACYTSSAGCGYDSLNVGAESLVGQPSAGTDTDPDGAILNSTWAGAYCDAGVAGTGTLRVDTAPGCWTDYRPLATIRTH